MNDSIMYWNGVALEANRRSHTNGKMEQTGPTLSARALAIVHLAMHDAYVAIAKPAGLAPYLPSLPPAPVGAAAASAVAGAAHEALSALFPSLRKYFDEKLQEANPRDPGLQFGRAVGAALVEDRVGDPSAGDAG